MFMFKCIRAELCEHQDCVHIEEHRPLLFEHPFGDACSRGSRKCEYTGRWVECVNTRDEKREFPNNKAEEAKIQVDHIEDFKFGDTKLYGIVVEGSYEETEEA